MINKNVNVINFLIIFLNAKFRVHKQSGYEIVLISHNFIYFFYIILLFSYIDIIINVWKIIYSFHNTLLLKMIKNERSEFFSLHGCTNQILWVSHSEIAFRVMKIKVFFFPWRCWIILFHYKLLYLLRKVY